jgi:hypothetical protein
MIHGHSHVEVEVRVYAQDHRNLRGVRLLGADRRHLISSLRSVAISFHPRSGRERTIL